MYVCREASINFITIKLIKKKVENKRPDRERKAGMYQETGNTVLETKHRAV